MTPEEHLPEEHLPEEHLVVFAKAPRRGRVKRRLAAGIGEAAALAFYRQTLEALLRRVGRDRRWRTWIAVTPDRAAAEAGPWPPDIPRRAQGGGDLGARMTRAFAAPGAGRVAIVGSDVPDVRARHVAVAFAALDTHDAVFGPAGDGGYWLIGLRRPAAAADLFRNVRWSTQHALSDTLANLGPNQTAAFLEMLDDIDDKAAYERYLRRRSG